MPTLHGATPAVKSKHRQTYFPIKILLFQQFLIFLKHLVFLDCQHDLIPKSLLLQLEAGRNFETFIVEYFRHRAHFKH